MQKLSMAELNRLSPEHYKTVEKLPLTLVLDNIRSGLNIGSVFRTADAFAVAQIALCGITAQPPHREILKTALGSTETVDWFYAPDTLAALARLKSEGCRILAVEQTTPKVWLQEFQPEAGCRYALVFGNEVEGVSPEVLEQCDGALEIPQFGTKHSLNIAVAVGIVVWEMRKRMKSA